MGSAESFFWLRIPPNGWKERIMSKFKGDEIGRTVFFILIDDGFCREKARRRSGTIFATVHATYPGW